MNEEQSELNINAADNADISLQEGHDDLGNLFDEIETPLLSDGNILIRVPSSANCNVMTDLLTSSSLWHKCDNQTMLLSVLP